MESTLQTSPRVRQGLFDLLNAADVESGEGDPVMERMR